MDLGKKLVQNWVNVLEKHKSKSMFELYSNTGILFGTFAPKPLVGKEQIKTYFDDFVKLKPEGEITWHYNQKLGFRKIVVDGNYTFKLDDKENPGERKEVDARFTFIFRRDCFFRWKILTHHSSKRPVLKE